MANYPAPPQHRMAYDRDGTQGVYTTDDWVTINKQLTTTELQGLNDQSVTPIFQTSNSRPGVALIFPELRDVDAAYANSLFGQDCEVSADTTNGIDGTWTAIPSIFGGTSVEAMRENIVSQTSLAVRAIRTGCSASGAFNLATLHVYGEISPGENPDRLEIWDATLDQRAGPAVFDFEDAPRASSLDKTFRVKNLSTTKTAVDIRVAMETLTEASPSFVGQHTLSTDGSTFLAQVSIGDLAPGAISGVITLRQALATNAALSLWWMRVFASPDHWL